MKVVIFSSPTRKRMLSRLLKELSGFDVSIIDDEETFGKRNFWKRYQQALKICSESSYDWFMICPDDIKDLDIEFIIRYTQAMKTRKGVLNLITDTRTHQWGKRYIKSKDLQIDEHKLVDVGFFDCGGIFNRETLKEMNVTEPRPNWWKRGEGISSGVGYQLTNQLRRIPVPMYYVYPSICKHGNHKSVMHPKERELNPLKSI